MFCLPPCSILMFQWCFFHMYLPSCFLLSFNFFPSSFYSVVIISFFLCAAFISRSHSFFVLFSCHSFPSFLHSTVILSLFYTWFYSVVILSFLLLSFFLFLFRGHSICYFILSSFLYFLFSTTPKRGSANCIRDKLIKGNILFFYFS